MALPLPFRPRMTESTLAVFRRSAAGLLVAAACAAAACDEPLKEVAGPSPNLQPAFGSVKTKVFESRDLAGRTSCVTCHTTRARNPASGLSLRTDPFSALVTTPGRERQGAVRSRHQRRGYAAERPAVSQVQTGPGDPARIEPGAPDN